MASVNRSVDRYVAGLAEVHLAVMEEAEKIGGRARVLLEEHRETGNAQIEVRATGRKDAVVELVDPGALSIEFGHFAGDSNLGVRRYVAGLNILARAADL